MKGGDTIKDRIKKLRKALNLTQYEFAERINMKGNTIGTYEIGKITPSESTKSNICNVFGVNREWLDTGLGPMFVEQSRKEEIAEIVGELLKGDDNFKRRLIYGLAKLSEAEWKVIERLAKEAVKESDPE